MTQFLDLIVWTYFFVALEAVLFSTRRLAVKVGRTAPHIWNRFSYVDADGERSFRNREFHDYIWRREYEALNDEEITRMGRLARSKRFFLALALATVVAYYVAPLLLRLA